MRGTTVHYTCKTERFQAVQESAQYRVVELVQTIGGQRKCFYSEFHALSDHQKTVIGQLLFSDDRLVRETLSKNTSSVLLLFGTLYML